MTPPPDSHPLPRFPFNLEAPLQALRTQASGLCKQVWAFVGGITARSAEELTLSCTQGGTRALPGNQDQSHGPACLFQREDFRLLFTASEYRCVPTHLISLSRKT